MNSGKVCSKEFCDVGAAVSLNSVARASDQLSFIVDAVVDVDEMVKKVMKISMKEKPAKDNPSSKKQK